jgi:hypothetical protein
MKKFKVNCRVLYWYDEVRIVEAESADDIDDEVVEDGEVIESDIDTLDQINSIDSIEEIEDDED